MLSKEYIENIVRNALTEEFFIVDITLSKSNEIEVVIDGDHGVSIQQCVDLSRSIEQALNRDEDDFELSVSSAGLGKAFRVYRQYIKNIGKEVEVAVSENKPVKGILKSVDEQGFEIEVTTLEKLEEKKKKVAVTRTQRVEFASKPTVKNIISFK
ncbi:MAG: ribosome assembly cofactor RimP [Prolixibacteraceae bacterium]|nr:ribosome assembly cofactor RimP [Prolixibacteraceae bacterium]